jgi:hypothetical protein
MATHRYRQWVYVSVITREEGRWLKGHFLMNSSGMAENSRKLFLCLIDLAMEKGDEERANGKSDTN